MKTAVIGASPNPSRFSHQVTLLLQDQGYPVVPIGIRSGSIGDQPILDLRDKPVVSEIHTITLYMNASNQLPWYDYILALKPKRIIFNPGAENLDLYRKAQNTGIEVLEACTLVMLTVGSY